MAQKIHPDRADDEADRAWRTQLMSEANLVVDDGTVTSHVKRVRRKFQAVDPAFDHIETAYGMGYRWKE